MATEVVAVATLNPFESNLLCGGFPVRAVRMIAAGAPSEAALGSRRAERPAPIALLLVCVVRHLGLFSVDVQYDIRRYPKNHLELQRCVHVR